MRSEVAIAAIIMRSEVAIAAIIMRSEVAIAAIIVRSEVAKISMFTVFYNKLDHKNCSILFQCQFTTNKKRES